MDLSHIYHSHLGTLSEDVKSFFSKHLGASLEDNDCICKCHLVEARRNITKDDYTPKWTKKQKSHATKLCLHPECSTPQERVNAVSFTSKTTISATLGLTNIPENEDTHLCIHHYQLLYRTLRKQSSVPCAACGAKPLWDTQFSRHCPDCKLIVEHTRSTIGEELNLMPTDVICSSCYKLHLQIINKSQSKNESCDRYLKDLINKLDAQRRKENDIAQSALLAVALFIANEIYNQRAMLLPQASKIFLKEYGADNDDMYNVNIEYNKTCIKYSSKWLLGQLIIILGVHMSYKCIHKKYGVVLYRNNGDLLCSLSWALGSINTSTHYEIPPIINSPQASEEQVLIRAASIINDNLLKDTKVSIANKRETEDSPDGLNIDKAINDMSPVLLKFIENCTKSNRERTYHQLSEHLIHLKKLRRYFTLCLMQSTCNTELTLPMHNILADVVQVCGGSRLLLKILNQFGCVSSPDTYDRFVTSHAMRQSERVIWDEMSKHTFTVMSADNFDILQTHAAVYCGDQSRSYHATTIQAVQPNSQLQVNCCHLLSPESNNRRRHSNSPLSSPHALGKEGPKRKRTVLSKPLPHPSLVSTPDSFVPPTVELNSFLIAENDLFEIHSLQVFLFLYSSFKKSYTLNKKELNPYLYNIKSFLSSTTQYAITAKSNVHYLELVDENPDSINTLAFIADHLLKEFNSECQNGFVILVGDAKTYQYLIKIKNQYREAMSKLLIFPGDWHLFKNFQEVLMKQYFHSGLKEIAMESGFRGSTLNKRKLNEKEKKLKNVRVSKEKVRLV